ncbi:hypothetical protein [Streptomyces sp. CC53]|uniref:hypothetical protein n=1 Tax=Streptomyces sp. CC53 TaxID=1906740 RepID=UPI00115FA916|nr:hypothetical protein [Streptomyces sp. CC53]
MKEPKGHFEHEDDEHGLTGECYGCGHEWPCPKWRAWTSSKDYRIQELERKVERLGLDSAGNRRELSNLREAHRRLQLLVRGGIMLALRDAGAGSITEEVTREAIDVTPPFSAFKEFTPGLTEYTVTYTGPNSTYVNGQLESQVWSSG